MTDPRQPWAFDSTALDTESLELAATDARALGSPAEARAREHVARELAALGLDVARHEFPTLGWSVAGVPELAITDPAPQPLRALPLTFSAPTPPGGVRGTLEPVGEHWVAGLHRFPKLRIADAGGRTAGYVSGRRDGPAIPLPLAESSSPLPHFLVGAEDLARIEEALAGEAPVTVAGTLDAQLDREATGVNLSARIPGTTADGARIGLCAHLDTLDATVARNGEAHALLALLMLARHYARAGSPHTLDLMVFTGTAFDLAGAKAYVADHPECWDLDLVINLDQAPAPEQTLRIASVPEALEAHLLALAEPFDGALTPEGAREYHSPLPPGGDHLPFAALGMPVVLLTGGTERAAATVAAPNPERAVDRSARLARAIVDELGGVAFEGSKRHLLAPHRDSSWEHALSLKRY